MDDAMLLPASDSSLAWVYEGATPAMTPDDAATAIRAATIGWTRDDHLQMGALQHHLAVALCDDPERQAVCSAAAYMHVAAAGLNPGSLLGKGMDPKVLRPKLGTKPERIGTTRSGKPIYNMFTHPAHASFKTADHVDHIKAMEAHSKGKKMNKAGGEGSRGGKVIGHTKSGKPIYDGSHRDYADVRPYAMQNSYRYPGDKAKTDIEHVNGYDKMMAAAVTKAHPDFTAEDHRDAAKVHGQEPKKIGNKKTKAPHMGHAHSLAAYILDKTKKSLSNSSFQELLRKPTMHKSEAVSILENFLAKSGDLLSKADKYGDKPLGSTTSGKTIHGLRHNMNAPIANGIVSAGKKADAGAMASHIHKFNSSFTKNDHKDAAIAHRTQAAVLRGKGMSGFNSSNPSRQKASAAQFAHADRHEALATAHHYASKAIGRGTGVSRGTQAAFKSDAETILTGNLSKSGEGSRGGKVIGHTRSGKPIYGSGHPKYAKIKHQGDDMYETGDNAEHVHSHPLHADYTTADHYDAGQAHQVHAANSSKSNAITTAHYLAGDQVANHTPKKGAKKSMSKSGEGSRGGKIIGHTKSGKPIYSSSHAMYGSTKELKAHTKGWTHTDHVDADDAHRGEGSRAQGDHQIAAYEHEGLTGESGYRSLHETKANAHQKAARMHANLSFYAKSLVKAEKGEGSRGGIMGMPVDLGDMQGSPIDGSYVDAMGGSHDMFMQQAELANCPTMWAPIATVPEN